MSPAKVKSIDNFLKSSETISMVSPSIASSVDLLNERQMEILKSLVVIECLVERERNRKPLPLSRIPISTGLTVSAVEKSSKTQSSLLVDLRQVSQLLPAIELPKRSYTDTLSVLQTIGIDRSENLHSDFISALLDPLIGGENASWLLQKILDRILENAPRVPEMYRVSRERTLGSLGLLESSGISERRIDLLIESADFIVIIENKVDSRESVDQTSDYYKAVRSCLNPSDDRVMISILLSPSGMQANCEKYISVRYDLIFEILDELELADNSAYFGLVQFYRNELYHSLIRPKLELRDRIDLYWKGMV